MIRIESFLGLLLTLKEDGHPHIGIREAIFPDSREYEYKLFGHISPVGCYVHIPD